MTLRSLLLFASFGAFALGQQPSCLTVDGVQITAKDLARALPPFASIPANTPLAQSPLPGSVRVFPQSELQSIAKRFSVHLDSGPDICFRIFTASLTREQVMPALRQSLGIPEATIDITELSTMPVPRGRVEFPLDRLATPASPDRRSPVLWRGEVVSADDRRFAIWARVWITAPAERIVALENLRQGVPILSSQVRREVRESFPAAGKADTTLDQVIGLMPLHAVSAGSEVNPENLVRPNDVNKGDLVRVEVRIGAARLALNGRAEATGRIGDFIAVLNPESSRTFQARVAGKDSVVVESVGGN